ncbi:hypothetical protein L9F63_026268, partial [Diploptera punctata]
MAPPKTDNWIRRFTVSDPRRHKKGFTIYKVSSIVYPRVSPEAVTKVVVWKRYNDFKKLHQELKTKHQKLHLQDRFPIFAKAKFFGRFEDEVVEERRKCAVTLLEFIGDHPPLFTSAVFVKFFESGYTVDDEPDTASYRDDITVVESKDTQPVLQSRETAPADIPSINASKNTEPLMQTEGPLLKLGGTWEHRQQGDSISLSSHSSDEAMCFTDTDSTSAVSGISSPLQSSDLQFFDPLQQSSTSSPQEADKTTLSSQVSSNWSQEETNDSAAYIIEATRHVEQAQQYEMKGDFESAFAFYKTGIACLLSGVQGDTDTGRKLLVREKTAKYLLQAEKLYSQHLASRSSQMPVWDELERPLPELQYYKVLGVVGSVMLVLNTVEDRCYTIKVLHKSPCPVNTLKQSVVPQDVPYMVKLHRYYETECAVFLILQHASGGKLWDHVSSYFQSLPSTPIHEFKVENVYLGKKLMQPETNKRDEEEEDHSYLELIRDYTSGNTHCKDQQQPSNVDVLTQECSTTVHETVPDLLQQDAGIWRNLNTMDLVENAQKLLDSVNKTLLKSETIACLSEHNKLINKTFLKDELIAGRSDEKKTLSQDGAEVFHREKGEVDNMQTLTDSVNRTLVMNDSEHKMKGKSMVRCKSEDSSHVRRRRLSSGRRRSITAHTRSSERRYSSDDLMEGHGRGITGSLDRIQQLSRLKCMIDCPKPRLPEANIRVWAAELVIALNSLHQWGIIC